MKIEFKNASHKRRENIFKKRLNTEIENLILDIIPGLGVSFDENSIKGVKRALILDAVELLKKPIISEEKSEKTDSEHEIAIQHRAEEIISRNGLSVIGINDKDIKQ